MVDAVGEEVSLSYEGKTRPGNCMGFLLPHGDGVMDGFDGL